MEEYYLQKVKANEENTAMQFINEAKEFLQSKGVDQWQKGYPDINAIKNDIKNQTGYFLMKDDTPMAYMCIDFKGEPAYATLKGKWLNNTTSYGVLHRLALGSEYRGQGLASVSFVLAENLMKERGVESFRADTDENNEIMKHLLFKNEFTYCGTIWFDNSVKIAYEKML